MKYFKNNMEISERLFWHTLESLVSMSQRMDLLEGKRILVAKSTYWIETR